MKIKNTNKRFGNELIRQVINFTRPPNISNFDVMIKSSKYAYSAHAYSNGSGYHTTANPFIVVRIGEIKFPLIKIGGKGYLCMQVYTYTELLVMLIAHELRHLWQANVKRGYRVWGARGQFSERDADAYALHKLREWRRK